MLVNDSAVAFKILVHDDAGLKAAEQSRQGPLALLDPNAAQVLAIQFEHVEGAQLGADVVPMPADQVEHREALVVRDNRFAVDHA